MLTTLALPLVSGSVAFLCLSAARAEPAVQTLEAVVLAMAASILTAAAFFPLRRRRERWLLRATTTVFRDNFDLLSVLGKLTELRDDETAGHTLRVTVYSLFFAEALGLPPREIVRTAKGALLHDIGKLGVADRILHKAGPLTPDERAQMAAHVQYGLEIVSQSDLLREATPVVAAHHERYDGEGYPQGLRGDAIPREARVFALVDVFDALTSSRVYKPAFGVEEALATMAGGRASHFDPALFDRFAEVAPELARRLPEDEVALTALLMDRLLPYLEQLIPMEPPPMNGSRSQDLGRTKDDRP